jgi:hypothetical protein
MAFQIHFNKILYSDVITVKKVIAMLIKPSTIDRDFTMQKTPRRSRREVLATGLKIAVTTTMAGTLLDACTDLTTAGHAAAYTTIAPDTLIIQWNNAVLQMIRETKPGPPIAARALAIVHTCIYDAWAAYDAVAAGTRLGATLRRPAAEHTLANKHKAVSYAAYRALADLYPHAVSRFDAIMHKLNYAPADTSIDSSAPAGVGNVAARAVLTFRHKDGANQLGDLHTGPYSDYSSYVPVNTPDKINDPNLWQPLRVPDGHKGYVIQKYGTACCGLIAPFAMTSCAQFRPVLAPARYPSAHYVEQAQQMLDYSANLTDEQKAIAEYWADSPSTVLPPGHWNLFAQFVAQRDGYNLDQNVKLFFILTNAVFDAGIAAWDCKRYYNSVRPVTAIHYLFSGKRVRAWAGPDKGTRTIDGKNWQPYQQATVVTPAFPEYVSGHSCFSASAAEVFKRFTQSDRFGLSYTLKAKQSAFEPGHEPARDVSLSYPTFSSAANDAGISRRYGGIHFEQGDLMGRTLGRQVGMQVWEVAIAHINGLA